MPFKRKAQVAFKNSVKRLGFIINRSNVYSNETMRLVNFLRTHEIDTVLDVGANNGNYALSLIQGGFDGEIYSFEAQPDLHDTLKNKSVRTSSKWKIAKRCAISDAEGVSQFKVTNAAASSSLLSPSKITQDMDHIFSVRDTIEVPTVTLSAACANLGVSSRKIFLKLDIQGGEELALRGAEPMLSQITGICAEMPLRIYYDGQATMHELDQWIRDRGFDLWDIETAWRHPKTGRLDYIDATYFRPVS